MGRAARTLDGKTKIEDIKPGGRITFRSPTWSDIRTATRIVRSVTHYHGGKVKITVRYWGLPDFIVRPCEIRSYTPAED